MRVMGTADFRSWTKLPEGQQGVAVKKVVMVQGSGCFHCLRGHKPAQPAPRYTKLSRTRDEHAANTGVVRALAWRCFLLYQGAEVVLEG